MINHTDYQIILSLKKSETDSIFKRQATIFVFYNAK